MTQLIVTDSASSRMLEYLESDAETIDDTGVRIQIIPGGCSGFKYSLIITEKIESDDEIITLMNGVRIFIDPFSSQYLNGTTIDFKTSLETSGFTFDNPNSTSGCGCGSSFSA